MSLRLLLLIIGAVLVAVIYLREVMVRKKAAKRHAEVVFDHESTSEQGMPQLNSNSEDSFQAGDLRLTKTGRDADKESEAGMFDFSITAQQGSSSMDEEQIPLVLHDVIEPDDKPVSTADQEGPDEETDAPGEDDILMLVITPTDGNTFQGLDILSATKAAGMKFGKMNIFHNYGVGDMDLDKPLFSLANLYEPGEFNLQEMESFSTRGLVIYMCLPPPIEAEIALELMLNTTQKIADRLNAVVCDSTREPLMDEALAGMRAKLQHFSH